MLITLFLNLGISMSPATMKGNFWSVRSFNLDLIELLAY